MGLEVQAQKVAKEDCSGLSGMTGSCFVEAKTGDTCVKPAWRQTVLFSSGPDSCFITTRQAMLMT